MILTHLQNVHHTRHEGLKDGRDQKIRAWLTLQKIAPPLKDAMGKQVP